MSFEEKWNDLTVEINRVGMTKATEILRAARTNVEPEVHKTYGLGEIETALRRAYCGGDYSADVVWTRMRAVIDGLWETEPEVVPLDIEDLTVNPVVGMVNGAQINQRLIEAYRRGKQAK